MTSIPYRPELAQARTLRQTQYPAQALSGQYEPRLSAYDFACRLTFSFLVRLPRNTYKLVFPFRHHVLESSKSEANLPVAMSGNAEVITNTSW